MTNFTRGSLSNPLATDEIVNYFEFSKLVHYYSTKGNNCFKPICLNKYVKATKTGKWERGYYLGELLQTTSADRITCPDCLRKYLPIYIRKNQTYLKRLNEVTKES